MTFSEYGSENFHYFFHALLTNDLLTNKGTDNYNEKRESLLATSSDVFSGGLCPIIFYILHGWCNGSGSLCFKFTSELARSLEMASISLGM